MYKCRVSEESEVKPLIRIAYSKITKDLTAKEVTQEKNQEHPFYKLGKIFKRTKLNKKASREIALVERLGWESIIIDSKTFKRIKQILQKIQKLCMFYKILKKPLLTSNLVVDIRKASMHHLNSLLHNFAFKISYKTFLWFTNLKRPL